MTAMSFSWLLVLVVTPLLGALLLFGSGTYDRKRRLAIAAALLNLLLTIAAFVEFRRAGQPRLVDPFDPLLRVLGEPLFVLDELGVFLLPFAALICVAALLVAPRGGKDPGTLRRMLVAASLTQSAFLVPDAIALAVLMAAGMVPAIGELRRQGPEYRSSVRIFSIYMGLSTALFFAGGMALRIEGILGAEARPWGTWLMLGAVLIRKGIFPFHSWMPDFFERVPLGGAIVFAAPQVGAYAAARFVVPYAPEAVLKVIGYSALFTAVYGACLALGQKNARRAFAYIFMSQSALVMAGLESTSIEGLTGGLCLWVSCGLSLAGFGMALWVLEARRGFLRLDTFHGGYDRMPLLASSFLLLGLASIGFPGTLGFLGEELLIEGAVTQYPRVGFVTLLATAVNGISILAMYLSLFCGAKDRTPPSQSLRRRELAGFVALALLVILGGVFPREFVSSRRASAVEILEQRKSIPIAREAEPAERPHHSPAKK
ncbi:MAG: oxidoreductase [Thermoanaerobaculia bacterium]|nr:oxidoreductase [Thermoanaerobaculia bacterium]